MSYGVVLLSIKELKKIYMGKKVLITGHTGFKGSYLCVLLKFLGAKVYGYSLKAVKGELYELLKKGGLKIDGEVFADIRDYKKLKSFVEKVKPDFIIHMAAQPLVLKGYEEPVYTYDVNVMGTVNLMQAINEVYGSVNKSNKKLVSILNVTTDKVYENNDLSNYAFKENDKLCGRDPYANSKSCSELVTYSYEKSFFTDKNVYRVSTARAGNVIGGGDLNKDRIIPDCYRAIKENKVMEVRNPSSIRPYQYVLEPLIIYLNIMAYQYRDKKYEGHYNIGPDKKDCLTTRELVEKYFDAWIDLNDDFKAKHIHDIKVRYNSIDVKGSLEKVATKHEAKFLRLDNNLIKKVFKYKKLYDMKSTMKYTAKIYKDVLLNKNIYKSILEILRLTK